MEFSLLEYAQSILKTNGQLTEMGPASNPSKVSAGTTTRITGRPASLLHWCKATEGTVIQREITDAKVVAGFERFSRTRFVADRYRKMGSVCESLYLIGEADSQIEFPVTAAASIQSGPLLREWFLVVQSSSYAGLLAARDLDGFDTSTSPRKRRFEGLITHHAASIRAVYEKLMEELDLALR